MSSTVSKRGFSPVISDLTLNYESSSSEQLSHDLFLTISSEVTSLNKKKFEKQQKLKKCEKTLLKIRGYELSTSSYCELINNINSYVAFINAALFNNTLLQIFSFINYLKNNTTPRNWVEFIIVLPFAILQSILISFFSIFIQKKKKESTNEQN